MTTTKNDFMSDSEVSEKLNFFEYMKHKFKICFAFHEKNLIIIFGILMSCLHANKSFVFFQIFEILYLSL